MAKSCFNCDWYMVREDNSHNLCMLRVMSLAPDEDIANSCSDYLHPDNAIRTEEDLTRYLLANPPSKLKS